MVVGLMALRYQVGQDPIGIAQGDGVEPIAELVGLDEADVVLLVNLLDALELGMALVERQQFFQITVGFDFAMRAGSMVWLIIVAESRDDEVVKVQGTHLCLTEAKISFGIDGIQCFAENGAVAGEVRMEVFGGDRVEGFGGIGVADEILVVVDHIVQDKLVHFGQVDI